MEEKVLLKVKSDKNKKPAGPSVPPVNNAPQVSSTPTTPPAAPDNNPPMGNNEPPMDNEDDSVMSDELDDNMKGDGNEDGDDKNHIQQLAGKLSQALQSYTDEIGEPDAELNKYVANMVVKQAAQGLSDDDKDDIIKKIENSDDESKEEGDDDNMNSDGGDNNNPTPNDDNQPMPDNNNNPMPQQESKKGKRHSKTIIMSESQFNSMFEVNNELDEVINDIIGTDGEDDDEMKTMDKPIGKGISFSSKPYVAPKF